MAFHPYPQVIGALFNVLPFGPPRGLTPASACPGIAHPASRPARATRRPVRTRLLCGSLPSLTSPRASDSLAHSTKGTPSHQMVLRLLVGARFQVLFHSPPGVLFTFPSRYWSAVGRRGVLSLGGRSPLLPAGFLVPGGTRDRVPGPAGCAYGALTLCRAPSHASSAPQQVCDPGRTVRGAGDASSTPAARRAHARSRRRFGLAPFRSPLLGGSLLDFPSSGYLDVSVPPVAPLKDMRSPKG